MRKNFNEIYSLIDKNFKDVRFVIDGRLKSLLSFEKKIQKLMSEKRSLDLLRDQFAFRIVIFGENTQSLVSKRVCCWHRMKCRLYCPAPW